MNGIFKATSAAVISEKYFVLTRLCERFGDRGMRRYFKQLNKLDADAIIRCVDTVRVDASAVLCLLRALGIDSTAIIDSRFQFQPILPLAPVQYSKSYQHSTIFSALPSYPHRSLTSMAYPTQPQPLSLSMQTKLTQVFEYLAVSRPFLMETVVHELAISLPASFIEQKTYNSDTLLPTAPNNENIPTYSNIVTLLLSYMKSSPNPSTHQLLTLLHGTTLKLTPETICILYGKVGSMEELRGLVNHTHLHYRAPVLLVQVLMKWFLGEGELASVVKWLPFVKKAGGVMNEVLMMQIIKGVSGDNAWLKTVLEEAGETRDLKLITTIMVGYIKLGDTDKVLDWYTKCTRIDGVLTNVIMNAVVQEGGVDTGYQFYRDLMKPKDDITDMIRISENPLDTISDMPVDVNVFNYILDALYNHKRYRK